jgi:putative ABC transport system permease protein
MRDDLRQAVRFLWRRRGVTALAALVLAVGIGATTLIFAVADAALFKPLPYREASRLVDFEHVFKRGTAEQTFQIGMSATEAVIWRAQTSLFEGVELFGRGRARRMTIGSATEEIRAGLLSIGMLPLLGVAPEHGRGFLADEGMAGHDRVVLLSYAFWKRRFGLDPGVIGQVLRIDEVPHVVVGILPARFHFRPFENVDAWVPLVESGNADIVGTIARLRAGLPFEQANREVGAAARWVGEQMPRKPELDVELLRVDALRPASQLSTTLLLVLGASAFLLLIACANVGNMLLALSFSRSREIAIRQALGASRARIMRQAIAEGLLLACAGAAGGVLLTRWGMLGAPAIVPARLALFAVHDLEIDGRVLLFAVAVALLTGALASLVGMARRGEPAATELQGRSAVSTSIPRRTRSLLVSAQVALTLVLLIGAGLLAISLVRVERSDVGFDAGSLSFVDIALPERSYSTPALRDSFFDDVLARVRQLPGVRGAAAGMAPPIGMGGRLVAEGAENQPGIREGLVIHYVGPDYFSVSGIAIREGRALTAADSSASTPVAVVSERAARRHWADGQALGRRFRYSPLVPWITVVGVANDVKTLSATSVGGSVEVYLPYSQSRSPAWRTLVFRTDSGEPQVISLVRALVASTDPAASVTKAGSVTDLYEDLYESPKFFAALMSLFAVAALLTAAIGLGGSLMYTVSRRTHEIGVRMALGANAHRVRMLVLAEALGPVLGGTTVGIIAALSLADLMNSMLYGVASRDPMIILGASAALFATAAVAAYLPAQRATRVDPMIALRAE